MLGAERGGADRLALLTWPQRHIAPSTVPEIVLGALGNQNTPLGAIALALDETDWLPAKRGMRVSAASNGC